MKNSVTGRALLSSVTEHDASGEPLKREIAVRGESFTIDEAPGSRWNVSLEAPEYWAASAVLEMPPAGEAAIRDIPIWRTTSVRGRLVVPENHPGPNLVTLAVESPPEPAKSPEIARGTKFDCAVANDRTWSCEVPAANLDIVLRTKGYTPVYRWGLALSPKVPADWGDVRLQKGASVLAWLDSDSAAHLEGPATAVLTRMIAPEPSQTTARLGAPVAEGTFNSRGAVQLVSVPAGSYILTVSAKGFAPARAFPIEVYAASETVLRKPVRLERPITVRLSIRPPKDPGGRAWRIELLRLNDFGQGADVERAVRTRVDAEGAVEIGGQTPGSFMAMVSDENGSVFARRNLDLRAYEGSGTVIDVPLVSVRGKVLLGDAPLPSDLWFGGRNATVSVKLSADENGHFEGSLPRAGDWTVQISGRAPKLETVLSVTVAADDDLVVRIPDTRVSGRVVDPEGGPVDQVEVEANALGRIAVIRALPDGTFAFRGLAETTVAFRARDLRTGRYTSSLETIVKADEPRNGIVLHLEREREISGRVLSRGVPVIGARVTVMAFIDSLDHPQLRAISDEQGNFRLAVAAATRRATIVVGAPGKTLQNYELPLTEAPLILELEPVGGTLTLVWPKEGFPLVTRAGVLLMVPDLAVWAMGQGEVWREHSLRVPNVAPGQYRLCNQIPPKSKDGKAAPQCRDGVLAPGGTLTLDLGSDS